MTHAVTRPKRGPGLISSRYERVALIVATVLLAAVATAWALAIKPLPFSDWEYYWEAAQGTISYERGGLLLFALRLLQALSLPPYATALVMNLLASFALVILAYRADGARLGVAAILVLVYLLAITPYHSVVQFDLPATALLCGGLCLIAIDATGGRRAWYVVAGVVLVSSAVSSRPQFFLVLVVFATLLALAAAFTARFRGLLTDKAALLAIVLMAAAVLGFAIDSALRAGAGRSEAVRTNSAVTLYAGLLSSGTSRPACGYWTVQATREARADAALPLAKAVSGRLKEQPLRHWLAVVRCKVPNIIFPPSYGLSWSLGAPDVVERIDASEHAQSLNTWASRLYRMEHLGYLCLLVLIYAFTVAVIVRRVRDRRWTAALLPALWVVSFWLVHSIFEIQARYFLGLFLVLLFMTASGASGLFDRRSPSVCKTNAAPMVRRPRQTAGGER